MSITATETRRKPLEHQPVEFDAEYIESLAPQALKNQEPFDFESLPKELKEGIEEGLCAADEGRVVPHREAMKRIRERLKRQPVERNDDDVLGAEALKAAGQFYLSSLPKKVQEDIQAARHEIAAGHFYTNEEVFRELDEWLENN